VCVQGLNRKAVHIGRGGSHAPPAILRRCLWSDAGGGVHDMRGQQRGEHEVGRVLRSIALEMESAEKLRWQLVSLRCQRSEVKLSCLKKNP
jgi:hypothetical protein